ncbi:tetratricopeptide repeat protein [Shewanella gelidii]|uniref:Tetratricopeptide repeat protein n=1 Tax=Shewanella gelidii TaxID=1642821 RepID=A0A917N9M9_9GAMM|nr:tetratricopeptide repeat protein [Shewanella gelidii]MCL1097473.1 tetratricopeptide repeat protein [Shewanella gelidii]GGI75517.1 hypothetical protein GCM10009332_11160 [Shewanella gelidii]
MNKLKQITAAVVLSLTGLAVTPAIAAPKCPIDDRQNKAVGERVGKKVGKAYKAYQESKLDEAIAIMLELNPRNDFDKAFVDRMLGNFYAEKGKMSSALKYLKKAVDADNLGGADHAQTLRLYSDLLIQEKKYKEAIDSYYKWMDFTCKTEAVVFKRIGIAHSELSQWDKVLQVADKGLSLVDKPDKGLYQMKLTAYFNKKQFKNAVKVLETMVPLFQDDKRLWVQLAQFYLMTENYPKSLATYDLAYKNGFLETAGNITRLAQLLSQKGSHYKAAKIFEKHMKEGLIESNKKSYKSLAGFYHNAKELKEAAEYYGLAAAIDEDASLYLKQGRILALDRQFKRAIPVFEKALSLGIKNPGEAQFELALAHLSLKQYKSAYKRATQASKDKKTARSAKSYISYIKEKARIHNVTL